MGEMSLKNAGILVDILEYAVDSTGMPTLDVHVCWGMLFFRITLSVFLVSAFLEEACRCIANSHMRIAVYLT